MSYVTKEEFLAMQANRANAQSFQSNGPRVGFLSLPNNNDSAVVRFVYTEPDDIYSDIVTCHNATVNGKFRKVSCLRSMREPIEKCPMCAAGDRYSNRVYLRMIEYKKDENGNITAVPKVFDRPIKYKEIIESLFTEYGNISDYVFKITRIGEKGSTDTQYPIMLCNPSIYNENLYPKDFSGFDGYQLIGGPVLDKSYEEMVELAKDVVPQPYNASGFGRSAAGDFTRPVPAPAAPENQMTGQMPPRRVPIYQ